MLRLLHSPLFPYTTLFRSYQSKTHQLARAPGQPIQCRLADVRGSGAGKDTEPKRREFDRQAIALTGVVLHRDRKSTRLNSSHSSISYAVFCLKKKISVPMW